MIPIRYIGYRKRYRDGAYGSGIEFEQGQTVCVPAELARKLLRHPDVYVRGEEASADCVAKVTAAIVTNRAEEDSAEMLEAIDTMDEETLKQFAWTHFNIKTDKRRNPEKLRQTLRMKIEQFGIG